MSTTKPLPDPEVPSDFSVTAHGGQDIVEEESKKKGLGHNPFRGAATSSPNRGATAVRFGHDEDAAGDDDSTVKGGKQHDIQTKTSSGDSSTMSSEAGRGSVNSRQAAIETLFDQAVETSGCEGSSRKVGNNSSGRNHNFAAGPEARWMPWKSWSPLRRRSTAYGLLSSVLVLTIRLLLDSEPTAYLIHSIVIFIDMFLIHVFTNCRWLSVSGELLTIIFALAFHKTKETVWELMETTLIAALCSFHMILSRNKHQDRVAELEEGMKQLKLSSVFLLQNLEIVEDETLQAWEEEAFKLNQSIAAGVAATITHKLDDDIAPLHVCGEKFFSHFLDGSAGVMYTSFLGLIINELLFYGESKK
mmetsp:Transcript_4193/g.8536  ORF Transcript_4193/g.8536 Transcript_4193/m.8536 type:complete len:360 (+) Transcript_4193:849-1928(+)|eukprot:scaffold45107_cov153-Amphora_coffeaeformis.AAC.1